MKKIKLTVAAVVGLSAVVALVPSVAYAADGTGTITYEGKNTTTDPTDPENPGKPTTPVNPEDPDSPNPPTGENGPLSIDYISPLRFGKQQTTSNVGTYNAKGDMIKNEDGSTAARGAYVQVSDYRGNSPLKGWTLSAQMTKQFTATTADSVLNGATIDYSNAWVNGTAASMPTVSGAKQLSYNSETSTGNSEVFATAEEGSGFGTYTVEFGSFSGEAGDGNGTSAPAATNDTSVKLTVPANLNLVTNDEYVATIKWTLATL